MNAWKYIDKINIPAIASDTAMIKNYDNFFGLIARFIYLD
jgi:hypothetical protein